MKILSWNICCTNKRYPQIISYIRKQKIDVACLQEVTEDALSLLNGIKGYKTFPILIGEGKRKSKNIYMVIISRRKVTSNKSFSIDENETKTLWAFAVKKAYGLKRAHYKGHYVDIQGTRIFNLHLPSTVSPVRRLEGLKAALKKTDPKKTNVLCGDFNTFGVWYLNLLPILLMKHRVIDFFYDEKKEFSKVFKEFSLNDIFKGKKTVKMLNLYYGQSDYILAPSHTEVLYNKSPDNTFGSDHKMVYADLDL